jgi:hypothetical protein
MCDNPFLYWNPEVRSDLKKLTISAKNLTSSSWKHVSGLADTSMKPHLQKTAPCSAQDHQESDKGTISTIDLHKTVRSRRGNVKGHERKNPRGDLEMETEADGVPSLSQTARMWINYLPMSAVKVKSNTVTKIGVTSICNLDIFYFPSDKRNCTFTLSSLLYTGKGDTF